MPIFGRTDTQELIIINLDQNNEPDEALARTRFTFPPGPLPLIPYIELEVPAPIDGEMWIPSIVWYADRVEADWVSVDNPNADKLIWRDVEHFMDLFTFEEKSAIALSVNPQLAALRLTLTTWHSTVHSDDPRVLLGLSLLEALGIISEERKATILSTP